MSRRQNVGQMRKGFLDSKYKVTKCFHLTGGTRRQPPGQARALRTRSVSDGVQSDFQVKAEVTLSLNSSVLFEPTYWPDHGTDDSDAIGYDP